MTDHIPDDLDPAGRDLRAYTDALRPEHRVVRNARGEWVLLRNADVTEAARDAGRFSSAASAFLQVPNGLDGDDHRAARATLDRHFSDEALAPYADIFATIARDLFAALPRGESVDAVHAIGAVYAVRAQSAWLGWPADHEPHLLAWMADNHAASRSGDQSRMAEVASTFDAIIRSLLQPRRDAGPDAPDDLTTRLLHDTVDGRPWTDEEIVSILRNWTGGDLGSIALCVGVLFAFLAGHPDVQRRLRAGVTDAHLDAAIDEALRIDDPFLSNRRVTTCPVHIGGVDLPAGARVKLHWTSANRDAAVFPDPDAFDPVAHAPHNLVYGTGPHACPGRPLATMELRIALREALAATEWVGWPEGRAPEREVAPLGGWAHVPVVLT